MHGGMRDNAGAPAAIANRSTWTVTAIGRDGQVNEVFSPGLMD
jgi:hypothetical protein